MDGSESWTEHPPPPLRSGGLLCTGPRAILKEGEISDSRFMFFLCSPLLLPGTVSSKEVLGAVLAQRPHQALRRGEGSLRSPEEVILS